MVWLAGSAGAAETPDEAARELATRILARLDSHDRIALTVRNASSLAEAEVARVRSLLESRLGARVENSTTAIEVAVTLSENLQSCLWAAQFTRAERAEVVLVTLARPPEAPPAETAMALERQLLWEQEEPVLDLAPVESGLLLLGAESIALLRRQNERWQLHSSAPIRPAGPWPRDLRGRLQAQRDSFRAYLPGTVCTGVIQPALAIECSAGNLAWPLELPETGLADGRNFFSGKQAPPFFSVARAGGFWIFAGLEGDTQLRTESLQPAGKIENWGSDIAGLATDCGGGPYVLATAPGDFGESDSIQAFAIGSGRAVPVTAALAFSGPVTALWPTREKTSAMAVARHSKTGRYAAFRLSLSCSR